MKKLITILAAFLIVFVASADEPELKKSTKPIELNKAGFIEKVFNYEENPEVWKYKGNKPAIVDFYATWCGPCRMTSPILADLAKEYADEIYIYKIDVDKESELAAMFGVRSIPTFIFIPMGETPYVATGALSKKAFKEVIDEVLLKKMPTQEL